jgi:hypothetical protein
MDEKKSFAECNFTTPLKYLAHEVQTKHGWKVIEKTQIEFSRTFRQTAFSLWCAHQTSVKNQQNANFC